MSYRRLLTIVLSLALAGCSTIQSIFDPLSPGADASAAFVLSAQGILGRIISWVVYPAQGLLLAPIRAIWG